jgi:hypothetical protein
MPATADLNRFISHHQQLDMIQFNVTQSSSANIVSRPGWVALQHLALCRALQMLPCHFSRQFVRTTWIAISALTAAVHVLAQPALEPRSDIRETYDFEPSAMTYEQQASRARSLSQLWSRYDRSPQAYRDALRQELQTQGNRELLYCDGAMLLLVKSPDPEDQALGVSSLRKCSLAEIQHTPYFYTLHRLARLGVDTFDLQARILIRPKYSVFIVQHVLTLSQDYAFVYPFLVQSEASYTPRLIALLRQEKDAVAQKSILLALWYAATPEAEATLHSSVNDQNLDVSARQKTYQFAKRLEKIRNWKNSDPALQGLLDAVGARPGTSEEKLRSKRIERMQSISDEALHDLEAYTALIYRTRG